MDIVIRHGTVVTVDPERRIILDGAVGIAGDQIVWVGKDAELPEAPGAREIDAEHKIVMPGLVNPHIHVAHQLGRGCGDDLPFTEWLPAMFRIVDEFDAEHWTMSATLSVLEMIKSGTTCFADPSMYYHFDEVADVVVSSGIRAVLGKNITDSGPNELTGPAAWLARPFKAREMSIDAALEIYERWNGTADGRLGVRLSPQIWPACSEAGFREIAAIMDERGIGALIHHTESKKWGSFVMEQYGKPPTMMLQDFGVLGPNTLLENTAILSEEEMDVIGETGTCVNILPISNVKNVLGIFDISRLESHGTPLSVGTSGGLINNVNDIFLEMKAIAFEQRALTDRADAVRAERILEIATIDGARCLGLQDSIGSIEVGKKADVVLVDAYQPHMVPTFDVVSNLVYCATGRDVATTIINGEIVMEDRQVASIDEATVLDQVISQGSAPARASGVSEEPHARTMWPVS